jgi:heme exporter protein CcmD
MIAMEYAGFVFGSWGVVAAVLLTYAVRLVLRGRALSRSVEPEHRRWMQSSSSDRTSS